MSVQALLAAPAAPTIEWGAVSPVLVVLGTAVVGVLVEAFVPRRARFPVQVTLALGALAAALVLVVGLAGTQLVAVEGSVAVDGPTLFIQGTLAVLGVLVLLGYAERRVDPAGDAFAPAASSLPGSEAEQLLTRLRVTQTEVYPLTLFSLGGMMLFTAANDLLTMFVALEVLSLPLYLLCGMARRRRLLSQEAALKYFLLGAFASAFFLYGAALLYGYAGSLRFSEIDVAVSSRVGADPLLLTGVGLLLVGLLFKVGAVPFHAWTPDVYQGAPTPVTGFMAAATKLAAFGGMLRLLYVALGGLVADWRPVLWVVAVLTMAVGAVVALAQSDIKRMLAYSSIAHAGFVLVGVLAASTAATASILFYLAAYGVATVGAFAVVTLVRDAGGEATHLSKWAGLGRRSPAVAATFTLFLLGFAGIPLTSGFVGKLVVFSAAEQAGQAWLVVVALVASAVAAFFYIRVVVLMFLSEPTAQGPSVAVPSVLTTMTIAAAATLTLVLGILPGPLLSLAEQAATFVR